METVLGGRYRLLDVIGEGGMSVVWRAHDDLLERDVAVKVLRDGGDERFRTAIRAEAKAAARLASPRVAHIYDYGETSESDQQVPYLVMELVVGEALSVRLNGAATLPWRETAAIGAQISEALLAAHGLGLVHRDIKPDNVILTADGVKLIDFGISALVGAPDMDADGRLLGTAAYIAPERLADAPVGVEADVYALGVLLYRMLAGTLPWDSDGRTQLLAAHLFVPPRALPPIAGMPPLLSQLCIACLEKEPHRRPAIAALAAELRRISDEHDAAAAPPIPTATREMLIPAFADTEGVAAPVASHRNGKRIAVLAGLGALAILLSLVAWARNGASHQATGAAGSATTCTAALTLTRDRDDSFDAKLTVANVTTAAAPHWSAAFAFTGGQHVDTHTEAVRVLPADKAQHTAAVRQTGASVTITGTGASSTLAAGQAVTIPLTGRHHGTNPMPAAISLNGHACRTSVSGASTQPATEPKPGSGRPTTSAGASALPSAEPTVTATDTTTPPDPATTPPTETPTDPATETPTDTPTDSGGGNTAPATAGPTPKA
jgi:eukaryotic-like serine/threonine-protein kinase